MEFDDQKLEDETRKFKERHNVSYAIKRPLAFGLIIIFVVIELKNLLVDRVVLGNHFVLQFALLFMGIALLRNRKGLF